MKAIGTNINIEGWALVSSIPQESGAYVTEYRGSADKIDEMKAYLYALNQDGTNTNYFDTLEVASVDPQSGIAVIRTSTSASTATNKERIPDDQTQQPTCTINGSMLSPQLHQMPYFTSSEDTAQNLALEDIQTIEWCLRNQGIVTDGDIRDAKSVDEYARWRSFGIDTYLAPTYTMALTFYIKASQKKNLVQYIKKAGQVWKLESVIAKLPKSIQPNIDIVPQAWLAQAPTIAYTSNGITISQNFVGAEKFPSFYVAEDEKLKYDAPLLPSVYWRDTKFRQLSSGQPSED
jgi:hypothetical protein